MNNNRSNFISLANEDLNNEDIINYLKKNDLTRFLNNNWTCFSIGIMRYGGKYVVYENTEKGVPFNTIEFDSFDEALEEARGYYAAKCEYEGTQSTHL